MHDTSTTLRRPSLLARLMTALRCYRTGHRPVRTATGTACETCGATWQHD
jgi:hypothetical protein